MQIYSCDDLTPNEPELFAQTWNGHNHAHIWYALRLHCCLRFLNHITNTLDAVTFDDLFGYALLNPTGCRILFHRNTVIECSSDMI